MIQPDLFAHTHTRASDPATSFAAARQAAYRVGTHKARIFDVLQSHGMPLTYEEIAKLSGLEPHAVARRLPDLEADGKVVPTDKTRKTRNGTEARLWALK